MINNQAYFLGGASPAGFQSKFSSLIDKKSYYTYILKGGPGTGKSTLMKKIAANFTDNNTEFFYCSSDPKSLDAVVMHDIKTIIVDGTSPHTFDPDYPAICGEIINLGEFWDKNKLKKHKDAMIYCMDENMKCHKRAKRYIYACASLNSNIYSAACSNLNTEKLNGFIQRFTRKNFDKASKIPGEIEFKQLSAITPRGYVTQPIPSDYKVFVLNDDFFAGGDYFLRAVSGFAVKSGYNVIVSECMMLLNNTFEHLLIPQLKTAFITANFFNRLKLEGHKIINFCRFYDKENMMARKQKINFDKKASLELAGEAVVTIGTALDIHDKLEEYYINSIDFDMLNAMAERLINSIAGT